MAGETGMDGAGIQGRGSLGRLLPQQRPPALVVLWAVFATSAGAFSVQSLLPWPAAISALLGVASSVTCGVAWLLARALFRPANAQALWPYAVVAALFTALMVQDLAGLLGLAETTFVRMVGSVADLLGSAVLVLTCLEAIEGFARSERGQERRFRAVFLVGYGALLAVGVLLFHGAVDWSQMTFWGDAVQSLCAMTAVVGATVATRYRILHPLGANRRTDIADSAVTRGLIDLFEERHIYRQPDLKIAALASALGVPEYKVSLAVTRGLGHDNVNQLINSYRINDAKRRLADPLEDGQSILCIAIDSGFASVGPFNRAFKAMVGSTPSAYRAEQRERRGG